MAVFAKRFTFTAATTAVAAQVNGNFDDLAGFLNNNVVHLDGSKHMTGALQLPGPPSSDLHAATKAYVDSKVSGGGGGVATPSVLWGGGSSAMVGNTPGPGSAMKIQAGYNSGTADSNGQLRIIFQQPFTNLVSVVISPYTSGPGVNNWRANIFAADQTQFFARFCDTGTGVPFAGVNVSCSWIAIGN